MMHLVFYESTMTRDDVKLTVKGNIDCKFLHYPPLLNEIRELEADISKRFCDGGTVVVTGWSEIQEESDTGFNKYLGIKVADTQYSVNDLIELTDEFGNCIYKVELGEYIYRSHHHIGWYLKLDSVEEGYPEEHRMMIRPLLDLTTDQIKSYKLLEK